MSAGQTQWKHYIGTPEGVKALIIIGGTSPTDRTERYMHHDHLGSVIAITEGVVIQRRNFDAWGATTSGGSAFDRRGFTGHEHLDEVGLIHMNGRIYDPVLGRFLQADPIIQSPFDVQSFNRYSYVLNNPLSLIDPTGYFSLRQFFRGFIRSFAANLVGTLICGAPCGSVLAGYVSGGRNGAIVGLVNAGLGPIAAGFAEAGLNGGNLRTALYLSVANVLGVAASLVDNPIAAVALQAASGCVRARAYGGSCGDGAAYAALSYVAGNVVSTLILN